MHIVMETINLMHAFQVEYYLY